MAITPLPPAPEPTDSTSQFNTKAFAFVAALDDFVTETNALAVQVDADAATAASGAEAAEAALGAANFKGEWSTLTGALAIPASVSHNDSVWVLTQSLADVTSNEPGVDSPNYWINVTIPPAGTSGNVLTSDGTNWTSAAPAGGGSLLRQVVFTSSGTWTKGANTKYILVQGVGGGGGGAGSRSVGANVGGAGGGAGGYFSEFIDVTSVSSTTVTIGSGGSGGAADNNGSDGGNTSFDSYCSATGGTGAIYSTAQSRSGDPGSGGSGSGGNVNITGGGGTTGQSGPSSGAGGASFFGGGGRSVVFTSNGVSGQAPGSGGGGAGASGNAGFSGGSGASGLVIVWEYA